MLSRIFPSQFDNTYRGHPAGYWVMVVFVIVNLGIGLVTIFSPDSGAQSADGVPLFTFTYGGAMTIIGIAALLGLGSVVMGLLYALAALRYRSMIPLMFVIIVGTFAGRRILGVFKPIIHDGVHPGGQCRACSDSPVRDRARLVSGGTRLRPPVNANRLAPIPG